MSERHFEDRPNKKLFIYEEPSLALWMAWDNRDERNEIYWISISKGRKR